MVLNLFQKNKFIYFIGIILIINIAISYNKYNEYNDSTKYVSYEQIEKDRNTNINNKNFVFFVKYEGVPDETEYNYNKYKLDLYKLLHITFMFNKNKIGRIFDIVIDFEKKYIIDIPKKTTNAGSEIITNMYSESLNKTKKIKIAECELNTYSENNIYYKISGNETDFYILHTILFDLHKENASQFPYVELLFKDILILDNSNGTFQMFLPSEKLDMFGETFATLLCYYCEIIINVDTIKRSSRTHTSVSI
jgi:hypothetical protein